MGNMNGILNGRALYNLNNKRASRYVMNIVVAYSSTVGSSHRHTCGSSLDCRSLEAFADGISRSMEIWFISSSTFQRNTMGSMLLTLLLFP